MGCYTPTKVMLKKIHKRISNVALNVKTKQHLEPEYVFFDNQELIHLINISKWTSQNWQNICFIGYSQLGNKIYYRLSDIKVLLNANYNPK
jgi:hypothetical protein